MRRPDMRRNIDGFRTKLQHNLKEIMAGQSQAQAAGENVTYQYVLKSYENKIAVYEKGKDTPIKILEVPVDTLPYLEQSALENGVQIKNEEELRKTIEDFTG